MHMKHEVFWKNPGYTPRPELKEDIECDYLIVGGGITGVSAAYHLAKMGAKNIVLAEKHTIGSGATGIAAGTLVTRGERDLRDLIAEFGEEKTKRMWHATKNVLKQLKQIIDTEEIKCEEEVQDTLVCGFKGKNYYSVYEEYEAEKKFETSSEFFENEELGKEINSDLFTHGMLSSQHALCLNPLKFIQEFSQVIKKYGVQVYENTAVLRASDHVAETQYGNIRYKKLLWAIDVDYPEPDIKNLKTTIIVTRQLTATEVGKIGFSHRKKVVWDSRKNEIYFKLTHDNRILMGFGGIIVHKKHRQTDPHFPHLKQLENHLKRLFPYLDLEIEYAWSGHFGVNKHWSIGPLVRVQHNEALIAGCASQVVCFMAAQHVASRFLGEESEYIDFFPNASSEHASSGDVLGNL